MGHLLVVYTQKPVNVERAEVNTQVDPHYTPVRDLSAYIRAVAPTMCKPAEG